MPLTTELEDLRNTYLAVRHEEMQRQKIKESDAYQALQAQLDAMTADIPDSREEYKADLESVLEIMNAEGITDVDGFAVKTRAIRSVDAPAVLRAMGGDIDNLMLVTSITQKSLEKFIKDNPDYKADLRSCIKDEGVKVTDVIPQIE